RQLGTFKFNKLIFLKEREYKITLTRMPNAVYFLNTLLTLTVVFDQNRKPSRNQAANWRRFHARAASARKDCNQQTHDNPSRLDKYRLTTC
ncbi:MAG TPA: hypothetical protein DEF07_08950, partial [Nitrosomonas sp.]|nr:hypothetical protein [Nitrosomonas sp.]